MRIKNSSAVLLLAITLVTMVIGCQKKNRLANTSWKFTYNEGDYTVFSFSEFYFVITDYRISENGETEYFEVTGSYKILGEKLILEGENGKFVINGETYSNLSLRKVWDGEYNYVFSSNNLILSTNGNEVTLQRVRET